MSETVILALIATIVPTTAAIAGLVVSLRNSKKADVNRDKLSEIGTNTDGNLRRMEGALGVAQAEIAGLTKLVASMTVHAKDVSDRARDTNVATEQAAVRADAQRGVKE